MATWYLVRQRPVKLNDVRDLLRACGIEESEILGVARKFRRSVPSFTQKSAIYAGSWRRTTAIFSGFWPIMTTASAGLEDQK